MDHKDTGRDLILDVYRCVLMYGICLLHSMTQGGNCIIVNRGIDNVLSTCVPQFMIISAWFGLKARPSKIIRMAIFSFYCAAVVAMFSWLWFEDVKLHIGMLNTIKSYWYVWGYCVVLLLSPFVESVVDSIDIRRRRDVFLALFCLVFVWGYASCLPIAKDYIPTCGVAPLSGLTLFGIYGCARLYFAADVLIKTRDLIICCCAALVFVYCGFYHHNSPFAFVFALSCFVLFRKLRLPKVVERVCSVLAPSMFAVYLLHSSGLGFRCLGVFKSWIVNCGVVHPVVVWLACAQVIFIVGVVVDIPRRLICFIFRAHIKRICYWIDNIFFDRINH